MPRTQKNYKLLTQEEQVLQNPDMFVGKTDSSQWSYYQHGKLCNKNVVPALYKLFDELVVNVQDVYTKNRANPQEQNVSSVWITVDWENGVVTVKNDGTGVPIETHEQASRALKTTILCPELVWFHFGSGDNFEADRDVGGKNGYGAKLCGVFSSKYEVHTSDGKGKSFRMSASNNMKKKSKPVVKSVKQKAFTKVSYTVDITRFTVDGAPIVHINEDTLWAMEQRIQDLANFMPDVRVKYNGNRVKGKPPKQLAKDAVGDVLFFTQTESTYVAVAERKETDGSGCVSFVNGTFNRLGGFHVDDITYRLHTGLRNLFPDYKKSGITHDAFKRRVLVLVVAKGIKDAMYDGQCKDKVTTARNMQVPFDHREPSHRKYFLCLKKTLKDYISKKQTDKETREAKRSDGHSYRYVNVEDLIDASKAGTSLGPQCTLMITEGKSALRLANTMIKSLPANEQRFWGALPIRGKFINADKKGKTDFNKNKEVTALKKALGLKQGTKHPRDLRYGRLVLFTDQDSDGYHIRLLLMAMFTTYWPELFAKGFLHVFETPIIKGYKGSQTVSFYDQKLAEEHAKLGGWRYKYFKGLGTSTDAEAKEYFSQRATLIHKITGDAQLVHKCMGKGDECDAYRRYLSSGEKECDTSNRGAVEFIVKKQFGNYALMANRRKIPSQIDGLLPSMRKLLAYALLHFKDGDNDSIVDRFGNRAADKMGYHHGSSNLVGVVVTMASDFCGGITLPYFYKGGQFGSRHDDEHAAGRYLKTGLLPHVKALYPPVDYQFFPRQEDEGEVIEPRYLVPIIPMLLVNGHKTGMGVGYKSEIPPHKPLDIIRMVRNRLTSSVPYHAPVHFKNFTGEITEKETRGVFKTESDSIVVTELPIGLKTSAFLKAVRKETSCIEFLDGHGVGDRIHLKIRCEEKHITKLMSRPMAQNWVAFKPDGTIQEYAKEHRGRIFDDFIPVREGIYRKRKAKLISDLDAAIEKLMVKERVVAEYVSGSWTGRDVETTEKLRLTLERLNEGFEFAVVEADLDVSIRKLNATELGKIRGRLEGKRSERAAVATTSIQSMWLKDLDALEDMLYGVQETQPLVKKRKN